VLWKDSRTFLQDVDILPCGPHWIYKKIYLKGRHKYRLCVYFRDVVKVVHNIIGNPALKGHTKYAPERLWTSIKQIMRVIEDMWTGDWWWQTQVSSH
jgi:hypothetical protein